MTTRKRLFGDSPGTKPEPLPIDLYLGVDCSGSMCDPAHYMSYPILSGAIMVLSALRVGARVKVVLSGEPGESICTDGFMRDERELFQVMTNYLGTGYSFGIHRLAETFGEDFRADRPVHILVISDGDMFRMLDESGNDRLGWDVAREAVAACGGGATFVLQLHDDFRKHYAQPMQRMQHIGWSTHLVNSMEELLVFARQFSRQTWQRQRG